MHAIEFGKVKHTFSKLKILFPIKFKMIIKLSKKIKLPSECSLHSLDLSKTSLMTAIDWKRVHLYGFIPLFVQADLPSSFVDMYTDYITFTSTASSGPITEKTALLLNELAKNFIDSHKTNGPMKTRLFITNKTQQHLHIPIDCFLYGPMSTRNAYFLESLLGNLFNIFFLEC